MNYIELSTLKKIQDIYLNSDALLVEHDLEINDFPFYFHW